MKRCLLVLSVLAVALSACGGALPAVTPTTVAAPTYTSPPAILGCMDPAATNFNPEATSPRNVWCIYATPTVALPAVPVYGCTDPKASNYSAQATSDNGGCQYATAIPVEPTPLPAGAPIVVRGVDLTITKVFTPATYQIGTTQLAPKEGMTLVVVEVTPQNRNNKVLADWPKDSVYIDSLLPTGSRANNNWPPFPFQSLSKYNAGLIEWVFAVSTDALQGSSLVLVLPDGVSVLLALPAQ